MCLATPGAFAQKARLPRDRVLERGVALVRDPATGELEARQSVPLAGDRGAPQRHGDSRTRRAGAGGVHRDRTRRDPGARLRRATISGCSEDGVEQHVASFDAAATPASIALLLDDSPSIFRALGETRDAASSLARSLRPEDEVAVAAFAGQTHLLLPFSRDRNLLAAALASPTLKVVANSSQSFIYQAVYLAAHELFRGRSGRKAIVLLTDGQDSGLGLTWDPASMQARPGAASPLAFDDVARELASQGIALYVISTEGRPQGDDRCVACRAPARAARHSRGAPVGHATLLALFGRNGAAGRRRYLLPARGERARRTFTGASRWPLGAEYTLGDHPGSGAGQPGWRELGVELSPARTPFRRARGSPHRAAYYVSAAP